jgi:hypothetical protein
MKDLSTSRGATRRARTKLKMVAGSKRRNVVELMELFRRRCLPH